MEMIDLSDEKLFGNLVAEDEDIEMLNFYFIDKYEYDKFRGDNKLVIVRARKGMGKSALLRKIAYEKVNEDMESNIVISVKGAELTSKIPIDTKADQKKQIYDWMSRICSRIALEIGKRISVALTDDQITLVENSELEGFKEKNLAGSLLERFKLKFKANNFEASLEKKNIAEPIQLIERYQNKSDFKVWMFIDDIDATFRSSEEECIQLTTFFTACRYIATSVEGLSLRVSVRSDVWSVIEEKDEAMDKVDQYMLDLKWTEYETRSIISARIRNYLYTNASDVEKGIYEKSPQNTQDVNSYIERVFVKRLPWGRTEKFPTIPIHTLSNRRPRWALQLCALAGKTAANKKHSKIGMSDIKANLKEFGKKRITDIVREHQHQCAETRELIEAFHKENIKMTTTELLELIKRKILSKISPHIEGIFGEPDELDIAHYIYKIGFIAAREEKNNDEYEHHFFEDEPNLLSSRVDPDKGYSWEIHPCFRDVVNKEGVFLEQDRQIRCKDCGDIFILTKGEQDFYAYKGLNEPVRCKKCRKQRKLFT